MSNRKSSSSNNWIPIILAVVGTVAIFKTSSMNHMEFAKRAATTELPEPDPIPTKEDMISAVESAVQSAMESFHAAHPPPPPVVIPPPVVSLPEPYACLDKLPAWFQNLDGSGQLLKQAILKGSQGLTDKVHIQHRYQHMYHRYLLPIAQRTCHVGPRGDKVPNKKVRILEIGLGCARSGGMIRGTPGGSAMAWRYVFPESSFDLELHIMEFDAACANKWAAANPTIAKVHTGDQSSIEDMTRVVKEAGGQPFDMIIDDGSHINAHQIASVIHLINQTAAGGIYVIEDIHSSCKNWAANMGSVQGPGVGGTVGCMETETGEPTIYAQLSEWQKKLVVNKEPFPGFGHIDIAFQAAVIQKTPV